MHAHRLAALRIGDVHVAHRGCDARVAEDALHLGDVYAGLEEIRRAGVAKLMQAVDRYTGPTCDPMNRSADRLAAQSLATACDEQRTFTKSTGLLEQVVSQRQIRVETMQDHLRQRHATLASGLAAIDPKRSFVAIEVIHIESLELTPPQSRAVEHRQHRH